MVMKALRKGASGGILKFILFGLLVLAVGGLVFTDVGGFFRSGGLSRTDVIKIGPETISIQKFHTKMAPILQRAGLSPEEAYQKGYLKEFIRQEVNNSLILQSAKSLGIEIDDQRAAKTIKTLIAPDIAAGNTPAQALQQRLRILGMSEKQLLQAIKDEMIAEPFMSALQKNQTISPVVLDDVLLSQGEQRSVELVILKDNDVSVKAPEETDLMALYEISKEDFAKPETRKFRMIEIDYTPEGEMSEDEIMQEKYALSDMIDDLAAGGASAQEITDQTGAKISETADISFYDENFDRALIEQGFEMQEGEISPVTETKDGKFIALELLTITTKSYEDFDTVKDKIKTRWIADQKRMENKAQVLTLISEINGGTKRLSDIGTVQKFNNLKRDDEAPKPLEPQNLDLIFRAESHQAFPLNIEGGMALAVVTDTKLQEKPSKEVTAQVTQTLNQAAGNEGLILFLENKRKDMSIRVNDRLLEQTYGAKEE